MNAAVMTNDRDESRRLIALHAIHMKAAGLAPATTIRDATEILRRVNNAVPESLATATTAELEAWLAHDGWGIQTKVTYRLALVRFFRWATGGDEPYLSHDPAKRLPRPRVPRTLPRPASDVQVTAALTQSRWPWRLHCVLAAYAGLRAYEVSRIRREHVDETAVRVLAGKGGKDRTIPTHPAVWAAVRRLPIGLLTTRPDGGAVTAEWVSASTARQLHRLGLPISLHWLRHWFATSMMRAGTDVKVIQELMGHASLTSTEIYLLVDSAQMRAGIAGLPTLRSLNEPGSSRLVEDAAA